MKRVVITGLGLITPLGGNVEVTWRRLLDAQSGISSIKTFDVSDLPAKIAGQVPCSTEVGSFTSDNEEKFNPNDYLSPKEQRHMDSFIIYGIGAAQQAIEDSGWMPEDEKSLERTGVLIGSGIGGLDEIAKASLTIENNVRRLSPFFIPASLINLISGHVSIKYGFKGPNHAIATACSSGTHAIGDAARIIMWDDADVMIAGGAEGACCRLGIAGFSAMKALSTKYNDTPEKASRPWDKDRDGFVIGEGAGIVVLEEFEHAKKRGAKIYAEIIGYGLSSDAYHITAPSPDGNGAFRSMHAALQRGKLNPENIDYINAHGTSTPYGDKIEIEAVKRLFGDAAYNLTMSSTKSSIGHLLGAAGAVEVGFSVLAIRDQIVPPTLNLENPSEDCDLDLAPKHAKERPVRTILSNSFGFGGTNASLILKMVD